MTDRRTEFEVVFKDAIESGIRQSYTKGFTKANSDVSAIMVRSDLTPNFPAEVERLYVKLYSILNSELLQIEESAFESRRNEIQIAKQSESFLTRNIDTHEHAKQEARRLIQEGKEPFVIKVWRHSHLSSVHPHHVNMHGRAVPNDMNFVYENEIGNKFETPKPCDKSLPESETKECRCSTVTKVLYKTESEILKIRTHAATTGGYADPEWAIE